MAAQRTGQILRLMPNIMAGSNFRSRRAAAPQRAVFRSILASKRPDSVDVVDVLWLSLGQPEDGDVVSGPARASRALLEPGQEPGQEPEQEPERGSEWDGAPGGARYGEGELASTLGGPTAAHLGERIGGPGRCPSLDSPCWDHTGNS